MCVINRPYIGALTLIHLVWTILENPEIWYEKCRCKILGPLRFGVKFNGLNVWDAIRWCLHYMVNICPDKDRTLRTANSREWIPRYFGEHMSTWWFFLHVDWSINKPGVWCVWRLCGPERKHKWYPCSHSKPTLNNLMQYRDKWKCSFILNTMILALETYLDLKRLRVPTYLYT